MSIITVLRYLKVTLCWMASVAVLLVWGGQPAWGQVHVGVHASGLASPIGLELDDQGQLWVAEQGTGNDDSRISIITPDGQVHPFVEGLPSEIIEGAPEGVHHLLLTDEGELWFTQAEGQAPLSMSLLSVDPTGFTPGDSPLGLDDVQQVADIGSFSTEQGAEVANPYAMTYGPGGDLFIVDASANMVIRRDDATGELSMFASFERLANPTPIGPPMIDPVPTGIAFAGDRFYVGALTGFPFLDGMARVYEVDLDGSVSVAHTGLTLVVDVAIDPTDGTLTVLEFGSFSLQTTPPGFVPNSGGVYKVHDGEVEAVATGLNMPAGMRFNEEGQLFVSSFASGEVLKVTTFDDDTAPVCGPLTLEHGPSGRTTAVQTSAEDPESGIASVEFILLQNLNGYVDGTNGYAKGDVATFDPTATASVTIRGERIQPTGGSALIARITNGAGLSRNCDPVLSTLTAEVPEAFKLKQNYPNPFNPTTQIEFQIAEQRPVALRVYDVAGREVATLVNQTMRAGAYVVEWDGRNSQGRLLPSGVYLYRLDAGTFVETKRMTLLK